MSILIFLSILLGSIFRFDVKDAPRYGRLERLRGHGNWASTKRFYSRQLEKGKVRYVHTRSNPSADSFNFVVTVPSNPSSTTATPATSSSIVAYIQDTFKVDIISNVIRVRFDSFCTKIFDASADFYTLYDLKKLNVYKL